MTDYSKINSPQEELDALREELDQVNAQIREFDRKPAEEQLGLMHLQGRRISLLVSIDQLRALIRYGARVRA